MTDTTYPRRVLAWYGDRHKGCWQHEDGNLTLTKSKSIFDQRGLGWVADTRVDIPQEPPEPKPEPGWYLARSHPDHPGLVFGVMYLGSDGCWYHPGGHLSGMDWQIVASLTDEQVDAIEKGKS